MNVITWIGGSHKLKYIHGVQEKNSKTMKCEYFGIILGIRWKECIKICSLTLHYSTYNKFIELELNY